MTDTEEQIAIYNEAEYGDGNMVIRARAGSGKCLGKNTPILMYDGSIKMVQDILVGDLLMGDDSQHRTVLNVNQGQGELFKINPIKGDSWICNDVHILSLRASYTHSGYIQNDVYDLPLNDYLKLSSNRKHNLKLFKIGVEFNEKHVNVDPYLFGLWLCDGSKSKGNPIFYINSEDVEVINYLSKINIPDLTIKISEDNVRGTCKRITITNSENLNQKNILREEFKTAINDNGELFIPINYLINSRKNRLELLAGLLDTDGHYSKGGYYEITTKHESLKNDILFLGRSLGFACNFKYKKSTIKSIDFVGYYYRITISGHLDEIPCIVKRKTAEKRKQIKNVLNNGFNVESTGIGQYYGFTLDGNGRFLLSDFTVTHNTTTLVNITKRLPKNKSKTFIAFNKHIQVEIKGKVPSDTFVYTSHGLGYSAIKRKYKDVEIDEFKVDKVLSKHMKTWDMSQVMNVYEYVNKMKLMINLIRMTLTFDPYKVLELAERYDLRFDLEDTKRVFIILEEMLNDKKTIDFTDMIYLPVVDKKIWLFPQDYVLVDECFPYNQNILTLNGKVKIGILEKKYKSGLPLPKLLTYNELNKTYELDEINKVWCSGKKKIYEVLLGGKRKIKSTINQEFLTTKGWVKLKNLKVGDFVYGNGKSQPYTMIPTTIQKDIIYGSILGDGSINEISRNTYRLKIIHGNEQEKYLRWKSTFLNCEYDFIEKNGFSNKPAHRITTKSFIINGVSKSSAIDYLNIRQLAIMFMDDGSSNEYYGKLYSTATTSKFETFKLSKKIKEKFKIESVVKSGKSSTTKRTYYWLYFDNENNSKLNFLLREYIHESMQYKLRFDYRGFFDEKKWHENENPIYGMIVTKSAKYVGVENVYDINMKNNHNFLISSNSKNIKRKYDYGLVAHNCQDLSPAQHEMIKKLLKWDKTTKKPTTRCIYVGDDLQSIYGFSGADTNSFENLTRFPNTKVLPLTTTFRCAKNIVLEANKLVPDIKPMESAEDGIVRVGSVLDEAGDGDFILARKSLPLIRLFFNFLIMKKKATIKGSDFGINLIHMIESEKSLAQLGALLINNLKNFREKLEKSGVLDVEEHTGYVMLQDKTDVLQFLMKMVNSIDELRQMINAIFKDNITDGIILSTIHKAKGLEANRVFIVRPDEIPLGVSKGWMYQQELNLKYIAITRAKKELVYDVMWREDDLVQPITVSGTTSQQAVA